MRWWVWGAGAALPVSLNPAAPSVRQIADLSWLLFGLGWLIWLGVMILLLWGLFRHRDRETSAEWTPPAREEVNPQTVERWWDVRYPSQRVITANEIHIPVGRGFSGCLRWR